LRSLSIALGRIALGRAVLDKLLDRRVRTSWAARFRQQHLARLVDDKDTASGALWCLLKANGLDKRLGGIAKQRVRQFLLSLEGRVCLGAIVGKTKDAEARCGEGRERVAEETDLGGACAR
jgi:hypothetical protein